MLLNSEASKGPAPRRETRPLRHVLLMLSGVMISALAACSGAATNSAANNPAAIGNTATTAASTSAAGSATSPRAAAPSTTRAGDTSAPAPAQGMTLKFDATFPGGQLNTQVWGTCYPWASGGCTNFGNTHDPDLEWYQAPQDQVSGGALHLVAQREPTAGLDEQGAGKEYACRSGMVTTYPSLRFEYGYVQVTAQIPFGKGLWPAFWLAAANDKWPPEVDMLEHWGSEATGSVYLHPLTGARQGGSVSMPGLATGWHTFGLYWSKTTLAWYYDGVQVLSTSVGVPQQDMYFIANLADDNTSAGSCSGSLLIKSVEVWQ
jgi:beta-glucanase (GH16 family)